MATQRAVLVTDALEDDYFGDIFSDERALSEELDTDDFLLTTTSANEDLWDVLEINDEDWMDSQSDGFFMP